MPSFRNIVFVISSISDVSEVLPFTVWIFYAKKEKPYYLLGILFGLLCLVRFLTLVTAELHQNNMPAFHFLALIEIISLYCFYCQLFYNQIFKPGILLLITFHLVNAVFVQNIWEFNSVTWTSDSVLIIIIGLLYFLKVYHNEQNLTALEQRPDFIIMTGWLIYASGSLFTYLMGSKILTGYAEGFFKNGWFFQSISNISKDIIISYGFWLTKKR